MNEWLKGENKGGGLWRNVGIVENVREVDY